MSAPDQPPRVNPTVPPQGASNLDRGAAPARADYPVEEIIVAPIAADFNIEAVFHSESEVSNVERIVSSAAPLLVKSDVPVVRDERFHLKPLPSAAGSAELSVLTSKRPLEVISSPDTLSIADLIEDDVRLKWPEAVAIALRLCAAMADDPAATVQHSLLEPRNITITDRGDVHVRPGGPASDPIVQQVGRILGALLQGCNPPPGLRLVASQASFDVPMYASVDEFADALRRFAGAEATDEVVRSAFRRATDRKSAIALNALHQQPAPAESLPAVSSDSSLSRRAVFVKRHIAGRRFAILIAAIIGFVATWFVATWWMVPEKLASVVPNKSSVSASKPPSVAEIEAHLPSRSNNVVRELGASAAASSPSPVSGEVATSQHIPTDVAPPERAGSVRRSAASNPRSTSAHAPVDAEVASAATPASISAAAERRQPAPDGSGSARRATLIANAMRALTNAQAAFDDRDFKRVMSEAGRAAALLADPEIGDGHSDLTAVAQDLVSRASLRLTLDDERVYTARDLEVVPPSALSRQLPSLPPADVPTRLLGRLEILVNTNGAVDFVRLHTPLNRYHERMIVSAAKAWRYMPALKGGKPVKYSLEMLITLPESRAAQ